MTTIQVKEAKGQNFKKITAAMTKKHFESQGFTFLSKEETQMQDGNDAVIFRCKFSSHDNNGNEMTFIRLMLFTGKENTIWATADFPECISTQIEEPIKNSLTSISQ